LGDRDYGFLYLGYLRSQPAEPIDNSGLQKESALTQPAIALAPETVIDVKGGGVTGKESSTAEADSSSDIPYRIGIIAADLREAGLSRRIFQVIFNLGPPSLMNLAAILYHEIERVEALLARTNIVIIHPKNQRMLLTTLSVLLFAGNSPRFYLDWWRIDSSPG
jgi:hypothetical protein